MKEENIKEAKEECKRFLKRLSALEKKGEFYHASREAGALKRSSLDLSMALSKMRQDT